MGRAEPAWWAVGSGPSFPEFHRAVQRPNTFSRVPYINDLWYYLSAGSCRAATGVDASGAIKVSPKMIRVWLLAV